MFYDSNSTMPTDSQGNTLESKSIQSWYNPVNIDPVLEKANSNSWSKYMDVNFDWLWPTTETLKAIDKVVRLPGRTADSVVSGAKSTASTIKANATGIFSGVLILTLLITAIVVVPRVLPTKA